MRFKYTVVKIKPTRRALDVTVEIDYGATKRWTVVRVPWRMLNEQYEEVAGFMASEAQDRVSNVVEGPWLPLEKWE